MKVAYPIRLTKSKDDIIVYIPDFQINTEGKNYAEAIYMARDAIGLMGIDMEDDNEVIPSPSPINSIAKENPEDVITLVDVDFDEYRRRNDTKTVRRNVSLPSWLDNAAKEAGINVSSVLANALKQELHITDR